VNEALPDPLDFAVEVLMARGALVERDAMGAMALLPPEAARALGIDEEVQLSLEGGAAGFCGLGSPLFERLVSAVKARAPVASLRLALEPPRRTQAIEAASRLVVRNGLCDVIDVSPAHATYVAATLAWTAEADDRYQGLFTLVFDAETGGAPDAAFAEALTPTRLPLAAISAAAALSPAVAERAAQWLQRRAGGRAVEVLATVSESVARRRGREQTRIEEYFASLIAETQAPRRAIAAAAIAAKLAVLEADRAAKLRDLDERYGLRTQLSPAALLVIETRVAEVRLRLRRRKGERELSVRVPPGARAVDALACESCATATLRLALCDDRLHVLCERCAHSAQGRLRCPACARR
jgi:hypothetical protein